MQVFALAVLLFSAVSGFASEAVTPEFLDQLLAEKRYDEFNEHMGIAVSGLSEPKPKQDNVNPMFNANLLEGDIMLTPQQQEQARQGIRFDKYRGSRWPNARGQPSLVPYAVSSSFSNQERQVITNSVNAWNNQVNRIKFQPYRNEQSYIFVFPGDGCWAHIGRTGQRQSISLGDGCVYQSVILHEMDHAAGMSHEHNRFDRDDFVEVLWGNIPSEWQDQYKKNDPEVYGLQANYDYYSIMHYPMNAPVTNRPAFRIKRNGIDESRIGNGDNFTPTDLQKLDILYS